MSCSAPRRKRPDIKLQGILPNQTYVVLSVHEVQVNGETERLVNIRNPWNSKIWRGMWSPTSKVWQLPQVQHLTNPDDKCQFLISYEDYLIQFESTVICFSTRNNFHEQLKHTFDQQLSPHLNTNDPSSVNLTAATNIVFCSLDLQQDVNLTENLLSVMVWQGGNQLKTYLNNDKADRFVPS